MCCQAPHSDGLLHPEEPSAMLASELAQPQGWEFLEVAWDSEGAPVLELLLGVLALRMERPCMESYRSRIPPKEG